MNNLILIGFEPDAGPNAGREIWIFRGRVPADLARECSASDPAVVAEYDRTAQICGPGFARKQAERRGDTYGTRVFRTRADALEAAQAIGAAVAGEG